MEHAPRMGRQEENEITDLGRVTQNSPPASPLDQVLGIRSDSDDTGLPVARTHGEACGPERAALRALTRAPEYSRRLWLTLYLGLRGDREAAQRCGRALQ